MSTRKHKRRAKKLRIKKLSQNQKQLAEIRQKLQNRITSLQREKRLAKTINMVKNQYPHLSISKLVCVFEPYLSFYEPVYAKRIGRLRKIMRLKPSENDDKWVRAIYLANKVILKESQKIYIKLQDK